MWIFKIYFSKDFQCRDFEIYFFQGLLQSWIFEIFLKTPVLRIFNEYFYKNFQTVDF